MVKVARGARNGTTWPAEAPVIGSPDAILVPGLVDVQANGHAALEEIGRRPKGYNGIDLSSRRLQPEQVTHLSWEFASQGTFHFAPTIITRPVEDMARSGQMVMAARKTDPWIARRIVAVHYEGPDISALDGYRGAHPVEHQQKLTREDFDRLRQAAGDLPLIHTLAPEIYLDPKHGGKPRSRMIDWMADQQRVLLAMGHTNADNDVLKAAVDRGIRLFTHAGNGVEATPPAVENIIYRLLAEDRLYKSLILDGHHLPNKSLVRIFFRNIPAEKRVLISDVAPVAGLQPGLHNWGKSKVRVKRDGMVATEEGTYLAGSSLRLIDAVLNATFVYGMSFERAIASATIIPAELLGLTNGTDVDFSAPQEGAKANFVLFEPNEATVGYHADVLAAFVDGVPVVLAGQRVHGQF